MSRAVDRRLERMERQAKNQPERQSGDPRLGAFADYIRSIPLLGGYAILARLAPFVQGHGGGTEADWEAAMRGVPPQHRAYLESLAGGVDLEEVRTVAALRNASDSELAIVTVIAGERSDARRARAWERLESEAPGLADVLGEEL
jgi:hypothetical protein